MCFTAVDIEQNFKQTVLKKSLKIQLHLYPRTMLGEGKINKKECITYNIFLNRQCKCTLTQDFTY